ncbi:MAG: glycosyltransferase [Phycisphaerales bacterium]|nr:glycosyltransferase [Phycisphaerales bacterium]
MSDPNRTPHEPFDRQKCRTVLAHDWLVGMRGGERVLDRLAQVFGPTTLYTLVHDSTPHTPAIDASTIVTSALQRLPGASGRFRRWYLPLMPWAVNHLRVSKCDLVVSTSSAVMKSIRPPAGALHLCYCHSPARYIWEQGDDYAIGSRGRLRSAGLRLIRRWFQRWDRRTADRVTTFIANSQHTSRRIKRCYGRESVVVYPPVRTEVFTVDPAVQREDWLLVVSALEPYKRVDLVIEAAQREGWRVRIVGGGSQEAALRAAAPANVEFMGRVNDDALCELYRRARALVFPQVEDFGIIAVEAQATGCPVIALRAGGALETVTAETGVFFDAQTVDALVSAVNEFAGRTFDTDDIRAHAERFSVDVFDARIRALVDETRLHA